MLFYGYILSATLFGEDKEHSAVGPPYQQSWLEDLTGSPECDRHDLGHGEAAHGL